MLLCKALLAGAIGLSAQGVFAERGIQVPDASSGLLSGTGVISGQIEGLRSDGLLLTDGGGGFARPRANDHGFRLASALPAVSHPLEVSLSIVRQPLAQRCLVEKGPDGNGVNALVRCNGLDSKHADHRIAEKPTLRDCFAPQLRGSAYTLAWTSQDGMQRVLDVTLDPVGIERLHHRILEGTKPLMESIARYPVQEPRAMLEMLWISPGPEGAAVRIEGLSGGMPLNLASGDKTTYEIAVGETVSGQLAPHRLLRYEAQLIAIGPLETPVAVFPLTCHLREHNLANGLLSDTWFAPGFGPIRTRVRNREGAEVAVVELLEIHQRPDVVIVTSQNPQ